MSNDGLIAPRLRTALVATTWRLNCQPAALSSASEGGAKPTIPTADAIAPESRSSEADVAKLLQLMVHSVFATSIDVVDRLAHELGLEAVDLLCRPERPARDSLR